MATSATAPLPLDDLLVVELGNSIATGWTGRLLADLGARVIRVDETGSGEFYRSEPVVGQDEAGGGISAAWLHLNRNKQSVSCSLDSDGGRELLNGLFGRADVLIDGLGVDVLAGLGHAYPDLRTLYPQLVIASITPFGLSGPYRDLRASDLVVGALGGLMNMVGFPEREPLALGGAQVQYAAGLSAFAGIMAAVTWRDRSSSGQIIDISMMETIAFLEWKSGAYYEADGQVRYRVGNKSHWLVLPALDGYIALVYQDADFAGLQELTGIEALKDERFSRRRDRATHADELRDLFSPWFATRTKLDIYHEAQAHGVPLGFVATMEDLLHSAQYAARDFWHTVEYPTTGPAQYPGHPFGLAGIDLPKGRAPVPGEHTDQVRREILDISDQQTGRCSDQGAMS